MNKFKDLAFEDVSLKLVALKKEYMDLRFKSVLGHIDNPLRRRGIKRDIARLNTILRECEKGIRKD